MTSGVRGRDRWSDVIASVDGSGLGEMGLQLRKVSEAMEWVSSFANFCENIEISVSRNG